MAVFLEESTEVRGQLHGGLAAGQGRGRAGRAHEVAPLRPPPHVRGQRVQSHRGGRALDAVEPGQEAVDACGRVAGQPAAEDALQDGQPHRARPRHRDVSRRDLAAQV